MFREFFKEIPTGLKIFWTVGAMLTLTVIGLIITVLYKLIQHL